jgi:putative flippase GtrA
MQSVFSPRLCRFIGVGLTNALLGYLIFRLALWALDGIAYRAACAQAVSYAAGLAWSFFWNRRWTFASHGQMSTQGVRFLGVQIAMLVLSAGLISLAVDVGNWPLTLSWIGVMTLITVMNYLCLKYWVF